MEINKDQIYTAEDLMEILQLSRNTVYKLLRTGQIKGKKSEHQNNRGKWRVLGAWILEYLGS